MTVLGVVSAGELGVVDAHDHLFLSSPALAGQEFADLDLSTAEAAAGKASGIDTIVEMTPIGLGRRPDLMRALSVVAGVHVIAATGYHRDTHYPSGHWVMDANVEQLAGPILADLLEGMHPADWLDPSLPLDLARAGAIKAGASYHRITPTEERRLVAAAIGSRRAGVPVLVHAEVGTAGHAIVDLLYAKGSRRIGSSWPTWTATPTSSSTPRSRRAACTLEYDTIGRIVYHPDSVRLDLIEGLVAAGHLDRLMLALDLGKRDYLRAYGGGPGMAYLMDDFVPRLRRRIGDAATDGILVANPARAFAIAPGSAA